MSVTLQQSIQQAQFQLVMVSYFTACDTLLTYYNSILSIAMVYRKLEKKLSSIEDRGQTDRVTELSRPYARDIDL